MIIGTVILHCVHRKVNSKHWGIHHKQLFYSWVNPNRITLTSLCVCTIPWVSQNPGLQTAFSHTLPGCRKQSQNIDWFSLVPLATNRSAPPCASLDVCVCVRVCVHACVGVWQNPNMHLVHKSHATPPVSHPNLLGLWIMVHAVKLSVHILLYYGFGIEMENVNTIIRRIGWFDKLSFK